MLRVVSPFFTYIVGTVSKEFLRRFKEDEREVAYPQA